MNKIEALKHIRQKMGYIPYIAIFDLWKDDEIIPEPLIEISIKHDRAPGEYLLCNKIIYDRLESGGFLLGDITAKKHKNEKK